MCYDPREATDYGQEYGGIIDGPTRRINEWGITQDYSFVSNDLLPIEERVKYYNNEYPE